MKIRSLQALPLDIPFVEEFSHSIKSRQASDAIAVKLVTESGVIGWGETLVRPYVTGESLDDALQVFAEIAGAIESYDWHVDLKSESAVSRLAPLTDQLDQLLARYPRPPTVRAWNGVRCGLELAILDAWLRTEGKVLSLILPVERRELVYSGVISSGDYEKCLKTARQMKLLGFKDYKIKVTSSADYKLLNDARELLGPNVTLRLDANGAFDLEEAKSFCQSLPALQIAAIEEPLKNPEHLSELQASSPIPIMVDEALVTWDDAESLVRTKSCGFFNIRLAKCGGIGPSLRLAKLARDNGIFYQLGALVGECAILSAAGRAFAAHHNDCRFLEGSYGTFLLKEDLSRQSVRFGHGGKAGLLKGPGLGVEIDESLVNKYLMLRK